ncbi:MAG: hypothetical protein COZ05_05920 [Armatimonadetes bacterium CG_4_10_14_3_um_filter_59_10]|nr:MAG: hypothetical protein COZ05_05920 [Armatimonadetes bacterium CG_4_10_14_3_um_filter_59_10]
MRKNTRIPEFKDANQEQEFWDTHSFVDFPDEVEAVEPFGLAPRLRDDILSGRRKRAKVSVSLRLDPAHLAAVKKVATVKSLGYQNLMRMWIAEKLKDELQTVDR